MNTNTIRFNTIKGAVEGAVVAGAAYAGKACGAVVRLSKSVGEVIATGSKKLWAWTCKKKYVLSVGTASVVAAGFMTPSLGCAVGTGVLLAASVVAAVEVIMAKRKEQAINYRNMVSDMLEASAVAILAPGFAYLVFLFSALGASFLLNGFLYALAYTAALFAL
jgi:hypothetical protein